MDVSYKKLWIVLLQKGLTKIQLREGAGFSSATQTKLNKNELVALSVLVSICRYLQCDIGDIMEVLKNGEIKEK